MQNVHCCCGKDAEKWLLTERSRLAILYRRRHGQHNSICKSESVLAELVADGAFFQKHRELSTACTI